MGLYQLGQSLCGNAGRMRQSVSDMHSQTSNKQHNFNHKQKLSPTWPNTVTTVGLGRCELRLYGVSMQSPTNKLCEEQLPSQAACLTQDGKIKQLALNTLVFCLRPNNQSECITSGQFTSRMHATAITKPTAQGAQRQSTRTACARATQCA